MFFQLIQRRWFLLLASALLITGVALAFFLRGSEAVPSSSSRVGPPAEPERSASYRYDPSRYAAGETVTIGTPRGAVEVKNFYTTALYEDEASVVIAKTDSYFISYDTTTSSFWVAVTGKPFASFREAAEQAFLAALGARQADACKLDVSVGVPYAVDPAGPSDLPLSFCF